MHSREVLERIQAMSSLPVLPQFLLQVQQVAADDNASADDLARVIQDDPALTARVLKIVNSAFYSRPGRDPVATVHRAVVVLGFEVVRKLALGLSVFDMMSKLSRSPHLAQVSEHSTVVAAIARKLAEASGRVAPEEAFVAALIHDIGKLALIECSPAHYDRVMAYVDQGRNVIEVEREIYGITHDRAGKKLASAWQLPRDIEHVIGSHHMFDVEQPPANAEPLLAILAYADAMSRFSLDVAHQAQEQRVIEGAAEALGIPLKRLRSTLEDVTAQIEELASDMEVPLASVRDYAALNIDSVSAQQDEVATRRASEQLELYRRLGEGMARGAPVQVLLEQILRGAQNILGLQRIILFRVDRSARTLRRWMTAGVGADDLAREMELPLEKEHGALPLSALLRRSYYLPAAQTVSGIRLAGHRVVDVSRTSSYATAPVVGPDGVMGVLWADLGPDGPQLPAEVARELSGLAVQAGLVVSTAETTPVA